MTPPSIAIAGATGKLGQHIANTVLSVQFRHRFSEVILLSRTEDSAQIQNWRAQPDVTVTTYNEDDLGAAIAHADILVNTISSKGHELKDKLAQVLPATKVKLYLPSEFGVDHTVHDFVQTFWDKKKHHADLAEKAGPDIKVCRVYCGLFLEDSIGPWFGYDVTKGKYESIGSADNLVAFTSREDTARAVVSLVLLPLEKIPAEIHIAGDNVCMKDVATMMEENGAAKAEIVPIDGPEFKAKTIAENSPNPMAYLRFLMGDGSIDHSASGLGNDNELLNSGETLWKWKTVKDLAKESSSEVDSTSK